ncbi:hypothetical protein [Agaribacillus aureus]|uniref:hypothetical protein n=1 Tax=Agaribacillus aureus TaxID=3051825 RepID=UPI0032119DB8
MNIEIEDVWESPRNFKFEGIYAYQTSIDIEKFKELDEKSKRKKLLDLVHEGLTSLAIEFGWDIEAIKDAYIKSIDENYKFVYHSDFKLNRSRKLKGRIRINLNKRLTTFTAEIIDLESNSLSECELLQTEQRNFAWWKSIRDYGWMDNHNFGLKLEKGELWLTTNTSIPNLTETFKPKKSNIQQLKNFLEQIREPVIYNKSAQQML